MKTIKEYKESLPDIYESTYQVQGYKDSIEGIYNDIIDSQAISVESIQQYLQNLMR